MATRVIMPKAGMAMETGTIIRWFKNVGDPVTAGEPLLEIQTDKVAMDVEAEVSGYLIAILRKPGDEVAVTEQIGFIGAKGEKPPTDSPAPSPASAPAQSSPGSAPAQATLAQAVPAPPTAQAPPAAAGKLMATPAARMRARELDVALEAATPTGPEGEIRRRDVEALAGARRTASVSPLARKVAQQEGIDPTTLTGTDRGEGSFDRMWRKRLLSIRSPMPLVRR